MTLVRFLYVNFFWRDIQKILFDLSLTRNIDFLKSPKVNQLQPDKNDTSKPLYVNPLRRNGRKCIFYSQWSWTLKAPKMIICSHCCKLQNDTSLTSLYQFVQNLWAKKHTFCPLSVISLWPFFDHQNIISCRMRPNIPVMKSYQKSIHFLIIPFLA